MEQLRTTARPTSRFRVVALACALALLAGGATATAAAAQTTAPTGDGSILFVRNRPVGSLTRPGIHVMNPDGPAASAVSDEGGRAVLPRPGRRTALAHRLRERSVRAVGRQRPDLGDERRRQRCLPDRVVGRGRPALPRLVAGRHEDRVPVAARRALEGQAGNDHHDGGRDRDACRDAGWPNDTFVNLRAVAAQTRGGWGRLRRGGATLPACWSGGPAS